MKKILYQIAFALFTGASFMSCLKEDIVATPGLASVKLYMTNAQGKDSLVNQPVKGKPVKIVVDTDADMCSVWPGGARVIMKKKVSTDGVTFPDSIDMFNHPVLVNSDQYSDYGLVGARGLKTTLSSEGWYCTYTYTKSGEFDLVVVVTNHGYNTNEFKPAVVEIGKLKVK
ncbi:hypothetical protein [Dyadobacter sp. LHD-138]|uniref:hypothetical protein n=1 Tax=Dyadobacter sp. LHD-138 TaxID=3071413 RepID=UPI0027E153AC|nr:hypothetical protein [Dyadobacter sp. LHD-138]MDQ6480662.1 hypothetical protein [Dyadobacter sp. LHD-138]